MWQWKAHIPGLLALISSISLLSIAILLIPQAVKTHRYNRCVDAQVSMRVAINPKGLTTPCKIDSFKVVELCKVFEFVDQDRDIDD